MIDFQWDMIEKDFNEYKKDDLSDRSKNGIGLSGYYGGVRFGKYLLEFNHTLDQTSWFPYANLFLLDQSGYAELPSGRKYDMLDYDRRIPIDLDNFIQFKAYIESMVTADFLTDPDANCETDNWEKREKVDKPYIYAESGTKIEFDAKGKEAICNAKNTMKSILDAFELNGGFNDTEKNILKPAIGLLNDILDGNLF